MTRAAHRRDAIARIAARVAAGVALLGVATGCGYRVVKISDVTAKRFAQDSAARVSLENQIYAMRVRCQQDSLRLANELAAIRAQPAPVAPVNDSIVRARDAEIFSLKDQLTRANAELDRIKKRLANPRP